MANSEHMDLLSSTTNSIMNMKNRLINLEKVLDKQTAKNWAFCSS